MANIGKISNYAKAYAKKQQLANDEKYCVATGYNRETGDYYPILNATNYDIVCEKWLKPVINGNYYKSIEWKRKAIIFTEQWQHDVTLLLNQMLKTATKQTEKTVKTEKIEYIPVNDKCKEKQALTPKQKVFEIKETKSKTVYLSAMSEKRSQGTAEHKETKKPLPDSLEKTEKSYKAFKPVITTQTVTEKYCHFIVSGVDVFFNYSCGRVVYETNEKTGEKEYLTKYLLTATYRRKGYRAKDSANKKLTEKKNLSDIKEIQLSEIITLENFDIFKVFAIAKKAWQKAHFTENSLYKRVQDFFIPCERVADGVTKERLSMIAHSCYKHLYIMLNDSKEAFYGVLSDVYTLYALDFDYIKLLKKLKGFYMLYNSKTSKEDVFRLWDSFYLTYKGQKNKSLKNVHETITDEKTGEKKLVEVKAQKVDIKNAKEVIYAPLAIKDERLENLCYWIHHKGDDSRYWNCKLENKKEGIALRRKLKAEMESMLDMCGYDSAKASGSAYRKLCELAYSAYYSA